MPWFDVLWDTGELLLLGARVKLTDDDWKDLAVIAVCDLWLPEEVKKSPFRTDADNKRWNTLWDKVVGILTRHRDELDLIDLLSLMDIQLTVAAEAFPGREAKAELMLRIFGEKAIDAVMSDPTRCKLARIQVIPQEQGFRDKVFRKVYELDREWATETVMSPLTLELFA